MRSQDIFSEERAAFQRIQLIVWGGLAFALVVCLFAACFVWPIIPMGAFAILLAYVLSTWPGMRNEYERREKMVMAKNQIGPLFIFDQVDYQPIYEEPFVGPDCTMTADGPAKMVIDDKRTMARKDEAIAMLKEAGNKNRVSVFVVLWRDIVAYRYTLEPDGRVVMTRETRKTEKGIFPAIESVTHYLGWCETFRAEQEQKHLEGRRSQKTGDEWLNENWFKQQRTA